MYAFWRQTDGQTDGQTDRPNALKRSRCRERRLSNRYHCDLRKFSFAPRIVNVWNSLPEIVLSADTTDTFKRRLHVDKFWQRQDLLYDYKVELTGVGNKSKINVDD